MKCLDCGRPAPRKNKPGPAFPIRGLCPSCYDKRHEGARVTLEISASVIQDFRRQALELRNAQKLVRVPLTSFANAMQIANAMGLAGVCMEGLLWAIDNQDPEEQS